MGRPEAVLSSVLAILLVAACAGCGAVEEPAVPKRTDGAELLFNVGEGRASAQNPAFSPDSNRVLFTVFYKGYNRGPAGLRILRPPGDTARTLFFESDHDSVNLPGTSWNDAVDRIAFSSDRIGHHEIWTVRPDGKDLYRVTWHGEATEYYEPTYSPDGQWIVFEIDQAMPDGTERGSIWKIRSDGTGGARLTDGPGGGTDDRQPNWSPGGDRILFQRQKPGADDWQILTMSSEGGDVRQVTSGPSVATDASWSPDGRFIVYSSDHGGLERANIFAIPSGGGEPVRVTRSSEREDGAPTWSPDGRWISFESHLEADEESPSALWRIAPPQGL